MACPLLLFWPLLWEFMQAPSDFAICSATAGFSQEACSLVVYSITIPSPSRSGLSTLSWCCLCFGLTQTLGGFDATYAFGIAAEGAVGVFEEDLCLFVGLAHIHYVSLPLSLFSSLLTVLFIVLCGI